MIGMEIVHKEIRHGHIFCGIGGGAKGFNRGQARVGSIVAKFRCVGGIDVDAAACRDFESQVRARASCLDLFSLEQYQQFHGKLPPPGWIELGPVDIQEAFDERPHIVFLSAPCKGFSGLLSEKASGTAKYQALNGLTLRGIDLLLRAYADDPVELIVFENVPRIATRGRFLLDDIVARLKRAGYEVRESTHDCGELGNLAQSRKRFLLVARYAPKIPPHLHEPVHHRLRGVGEVLDELPLPLSGLGGPMHRMPALQWQTWVRLAFVTAGEDWRSLNGLAVQDGFLRDYGIVPESGFRGSYGVRKWDEPAATVTANGRPASGAHSVADPRVETNGRDFHGLTVNEWKDTARTITTQRSPGSSAQSVADPRIEAARGQVLGVVDWKDNVGTIAARTAPSNGEYSVADPRAPDGAGWGKYHVAKAEEPARTVISESGTGNGAFAVADVRVDGHPKSVQLGVRPWGEPAGVITGKMAVGGGPHSVADPRLHGKRFNNVFRIVAWDQPAVAVAGPGGAGGPAVADPRTGFGAATHHNVLKVTPYDQPAGVITSSGHPSGGAGCVADPRFDWHEGASSSKLRVTEWNGAARAITGAQQVGSGAGAVADPRPDFTRGGREDFKNGGHYGVVRFVDPAGTVSGSACHDNGFNSVADPRLGESSGDDEHKSALTLPAHKERLVCIIVARDGTWHRPFTTLELAALQGLVDPSEHFLLEGMSDSAWRERIGNCVPPPSAEAIAGVMGDTLLLAWSGVTFHLSATPIWVRNIAAALSVKSQELPGT